MGNSSVCIKVAVQKNSSDSTTVESTLKDMNKQTIRKKKNKMLQKDIESKMDDKILNQPETVGQLQDKDDSQKTGNRESSTRHSQQQIEESQILLSQKVFSFESSKNLGSQEKKVTNLQIESKSQKQAISYLSSQILQNEDYFNIGNDDYNHQNTQEPQLISEGNLAATYDDKGGHLVDFQDYYKQEEDKSIAQSYNQKVKEDTNFLGKQRGYDDSINSNTQLVRSDSDILYNLNCRQSYCTSIANNKFQKDQQEENQLDSYEASEFIPIEFYDSDTQELSIFITDLNDVKLYQKIVQKVNSIGGIRKIYYLFKQQRRDQLKASSFILDALYVSTCNTFLNILDKKRQENLDFVLAKLGMQRLKFDQMLHKIDKDYHAMVGLSRKMKIPEKIGLENAKLMKVKMQERVMELWNEYQGSDLSKELDTERLLQILESFAEDELFENQEFEIEQIEKVIQKLQQRDNTVKKYQPKYDSSFERSETISAKKAVRMSIFTIDEEEDSSDNEL